MRGRFIVVEGIDGTGKHTIMFGLLSSVPFKGKKILDMREYWKSGYKEIQKSLEPQSPSWMRAFFVPPDKLIQEADIILTCEPTYGLVGASIRGIGIHRASKGKLGHGAYSAMALAQLYALDRLFLRKEIVNPAIELGKTVIQSRCEASSLVYEYRHAIREKPTANHEEIIKALIELEGNTAGLLAPPDIMLIQYFDDINVIKERFQDREKDAFEDLEFQKDLSEYYTNKPFLFGNTLAQFYRYRGSRVEFIDAALPKEEVLRKALTIIQEEAEPPSDIKPLSDFIK